MEIDSELITIKNTVTDAEKFLKEKKAQRETLNKELAQLKVEYVEFAQKRIRTLYAPLMEKWNEFVRICDKNRASASSFGFSCQSSHVSIKFWRSDKKYLFEFTVDDISSKNLNCNHVELFDPSTIANLTAQLETYIANSLQKAIQDAQDLLKLRIERAQKNDEKLQNVRAKYCDEAFANPPKEFFTI